MPPKAEKTEGTAKPPAVIVDGVDTSSFSREKLEQFSNKKKEELDREREERNYFQLERDKIRIFWEISLKELEEVKAVVKNLQRAKEAIQEDHDQIVAFDEQKIKFLKYEQIGDLDALKTECVVALNTAKEEHEEQELILFSEKRETKLQLAAKLQAEADLLKREKEKHADQLVTEKAMYEEVQKETTDETVKKFIETKTELLVKHRTELAEIEERKNKQISQLIEQHEKAFSELKNYYNDVTLNNLGLIASIKRHTIDLQDATKRADKIYREALAEAKTLQEPLRLAVLDNNELKRQIANYDRDKAALKAKAALQTKLKKENRHLKWDYESLENRFAKIRLERDAIKACFSDAVQTVKEKMLTESNELEVKLIRMEGEDIRPRELQELLNLKEAQVEELLYETALIRKAHDDLLATYEGKLSQLGVPRDELGLQPLKPVAVAGLNLVIGIGPANLVTRNQ